MQIKLQKSEALKAVILLVTTVAISSVHLVFKNVYYKSDWFLFADFSQDIQYYVFDTGLIINNCIYLYIIYILIKSSGDLYKRILELFLILELKEIPDYWLFHNSLSAFYEVLFMGLIILFYILYYGDR